MRTPILAAVVLLASGCLARLEPPRDASPDEDAGTDVAEVPDAGGDAREPDSGAEAAADADVPCWTHQRHLPDGGITPCPPPPPAP